MIDPTKVTILAISTQNLELRPAQTRFSISDYLSDRIGRQSDLAHGFLCFQQARPWTRCSFGWARGTLGLYRGWTCLAIQPQGRFGLGAGCGFAFRGTVAHSLPPGHGQITYPVLGKVSATCDQSSSKETDRKRPHGFEFLSHGSACLARSAGRSAFRGRVGQVCLTIYIENSVSIDLGLIKG